MALSALFRPRVNALLSVRRGLASLASTSVTKRTRLPNGFTVATEASPYVDTATVGIYIDSGSRAESASNNGSAHFLEHLIFKGTSKRSQRDLELEIENMGAHLNAYTSRESTYYYARAFKDDVPKAVGILADILQNSKLSPEAIERERDVILREAQEVSRMPDEVVFDHLHATAFQGHPLGYTILGPDENIKSLTRNDLTAYIANNYTPNRLVLVGAGAVNHDALVELAEKHFGGLTRPRLDSPLGTPRGPTPTFIGSEIRNRDDTLNTAHIAIAVEGVSWTDPNFYSALVAQAIIGNWDRSLGTSLTQGNRLSYIVSSNSLANSFMSFNTSYADTGLWGIYLTTENVTQIDDLVHFTLKEWNRLSNDVTDTEVARARAQVKAGLLVGLDSTSGVAEDIGRQIVSTHSRKSPQEISALVDSVTPSDVEKFAQKHLWDKDIAISALGPIEDLFDYGRIRNDMSALRW